MPANVNEGHLMLSWNAKIALAAAAALVALPALAQDAPAVPELDNASAAIEAATAAGLIETLASGEAYTAFIPTNDALTAVADQAPTDPAALATLIQGYVIEGNVMAADAMTLVTDGGGTATVDSLGGTPITLAMEGESLTVNGAPVSTPDLMLGNVTIHLIDGAYLPDAAGTEGEASSGG
jgi:uncharacterized surface protein with fasciclin (FAS1) repeats